MPSARSSVVAPGNGPAGANHRPRQPEGLDRRPDIPPGFAAASSKHTERHTPWRVPRSPSPRPSSTTAASAPAPSASRPAAWPGRPPVRRPSTWTTRRCCCRRPRPASTRRTSFDFFPLTVDVEERMYAAGRIPGSFFRREGRPSTDAILTCRLIDRPLRPSFVKGLRNEIQVVVTVLSLNPDDLYDVVAINAASLSTQLAGLPFSGPIGGVRVALIDGQWVAFPRHSELRARRVRHGRRRPGRHRCRRQRGRRDHDGRGRGHRRRLGPDPGRRGARRPRRSWPQGSRPPSRSSRRCARPSRRSPRRPPSRPASSRCSPTTQDDVYAAVAAAVDRRPGRRP